MNTKETVALSKKLSWLLRHAAAEEGVALDGAGWASIEEVLAKLSMTAEQLEQVVSQNDKSRFELEGEFIRATQGHSKANSVSLEELEASWTRYEGAGPLWHGTRVAALPGIAAEGLLPLRRTHVHLAPSVESHVGKRSYVDVLLEISAPILAERLVPAFVSPNGVVLARFVPREAIVGLRAMTKAAQKIEPELKKQLRL